MIMERILRYVVAYDHRLKMLKTELVVELRDGGRYYLQLIGDETRLEIELTPGLLQELRRTMGKIA